MLDSFDQFILGAILVALGVSTLTTIVDALGYLPRYVSLWINRNRLASVVEVLKMAGFDVDEQRRLNTANSIASHFDKQDIQEVLKKSLEKHRLQGPVSVGRTRNAKSAYFYDIMGATTSHESADYYSRILSTFLRGQLESRKMRNTSGQFDYIVTPKNGSPILGYELSKKLRIPLVLHCAEAKFSDGSVLPQSLFDSAVDLRPHTKALIVDDSTTGGRKVLEAAEDLKKFNIEATDCLVLFEPTMKNVRHFLEENAVRLHSVIRTDGEGGFLS